MVRCHDLVSIVLRQRGKHLIRGLYHAVRVLHAQRLQRRHAGQHELQLHALHAVFGALHAFFDHRCQPEEHLIAFRAQPDGVAQRRHIAPRRQRLIRNEGPIRFPVRGRQGQICRYPSSLWHIRIKFPGVCIRDLRDHGVRLAPLGGAQTIREVTPVLGVHALVGARDLESVLVEPVPGGQCQADTVRSGDSHVFAARDAVVRSGLNGVRPRRQPQRAAGCRKFTAIFVDRRDRASL